MFYAAAFILGGLTHGLTSRGEQESKRRISVPQRTATTAPLGNGAFALTQWSKQVDATDEQGIPSLAVDLLSSGSRHSIAHWAPVLARWSVSDAPTMIRFIEGNAPPAIKERLLEQAWFAWGASDPDTAFGAASKLSPSLTRHLLEGIAEVDPTKAAAYVRQVPDSQFAVASIASLIYDDDPKLADQLSKTAVYDGGRAPFERARIQDLALSDPPAAVAYAKSLGVIGIDPVPNAIREIAKHDPLQAAAQVAVMPQSRSKALSSVALTSTWAVKDLEAATNWARENLSGPVLQHSLIAAAASSTDPDPANALSVLDEAGWIPESEFFNVRDSGSLSPSESLQEWSAQDTARQLLQRFAQSDPERARDYLNTMIPAALRSTIAIGTGIEP